MRNLTVPFANVALALTIPLLAAWLPRKVTADTHLDALRNSPYPSAFVCKSCHPVQFREWSVSQHAYSGISPAVIANDNKTVRATHGTLGDNCSRCHNPVGAALGVTNRTPSLQREQVAREGVTCIVCHRQDKRYGKTNGRFAIQPGPLQATIFGPTGNEIQAEMMSRRGLMLTTDPARPGPVIHSHVVGVPTQRQPVFCSPCHGARLANELRSEETYDEYRTSAAARRGTTCQDCHMGRAPGEAKGFDTGPAAVVGGVESRPRRISNHYFAGPDYPVVHPGIFPHNYEATQLATGEQWLTFDYQAGWGSDDFENEVSPRATFPEHWKDLGRRQEARAILEEQSALLAFGRAQRNALLRAGYQVERVIVDSASTRRGLKFRLKLRNRTDAHNAPTGFIHERMVFFMVAVRDARGQTIFRSGDRDPNGDLRDEMSAYVRNGELPPDPQLFNLQSRFVTRGLASGDGTTVSFVPAHLTPLPFVRPPAVATTLQMHPPEARVLKCSIEPGGSRWARYEVSGRKLRVGETYTLDLMLVVQPVAAFFIASSAAAGLDFGLTVRELVDRTVGASETVWRASRSVTITEDEP